ncbi:MAG: DUF433 domain-containing protein [Saprospiraceae bacterium]|nr:DUF433 domain-containing protein [Saprospiraceae bacterium]
MSNSILKQYIHFDQNDMTLNEPYIIGHRIKVKDIVIWSEIKGMSLDQIANEYRLNLAEIHAALSFYFENKSLIDDLIMHDEDLIETMKKQIKSKI